MKLGEGEAQGFVGLIEDGAGDGKVVTEVAAHAYGLRARPERVNAGLVIVDYRNSLCNGRVGSKLPLPYSRRRS